MSKTARQNMLCKIHLAKRDLGLSEADYRHVLRYNFNVESAADLNERQLDDLVSLFKEKGWQAKPKGQASSAGRDFKPPVPQERRPLMDKIEALLAEKGRLAGRRIPWKYAEAILKRQGGPNFLNWATAEQLKNVVAALSYSVKRDQARMAKKQACPAVHC